LEALQAWSHRDSKVVHEILVEEVRNSLDVVFILEDSREFPDDLFIQFFLHKRSFQNEIVFGNKQDASLSLFSYASFCDGFLLLAKYEANLVAIVPQPIS